MIEQMPEHESHAGEKAEFSHCPKGPVGPDAGERSECVGAAPVREGKDGPEAGPECGPRRVHYRINQYGYPDASLGIEPEGPSWRDCQIKEMYEKQGIKGHTGPIGALGPIGQCPDCGGTSIAWDGESDVSKCLACGWNNTNMAAVNHARRIMNGEIPPENGEKGYKIVTILGKEYVITRCSGSSDPRMKDSDGFCDDTTREICAETFERYAGRPNAKKDLREYSKKVLRHEIIHAFLCESGLAECSAWAQDEEAVDWFARQGPKIIQAWKEAGAL